MDKPVYSAKQCFSLANPQPPSTTNIVDEHDRSLKTAVFRSSVPSKCEVQERTLLKRTTYSSFSSWHFPRNWFSFNFPLGAWITTLLIIRPLFTRVFHQLLCLLLLKGGRGYVFNACINLNACCAQKGEKSVGDPTQMWTCRRICRLPLAATLLSRP